MAPVLGLAVYATSDHQARRLGMIEAEQHREVVAEVRA